LINDETNPQNNKKFILLKDIAMSMLTVGKVKQYTTNTILGKNIITPMINAMNNSHVFDFTRFLKHSLGVVIYDSPKSQSLLSVLFLSYPVTYS